MLRTFTALLPLVLLAGCALLRGPRDTGLVPLPMVDVPGGTFRMGDVFDATDPDATPVHDVALAPFRLMATEVTFEAYDAYAEAYGLPLPDADGETRGRGRRAVINVSWDEAAAFCAAYGYRLPTEREWEYAAREAGRAIRWAGTNERDSLDAYARFRDNSIGYAGIVAARRPNALGLHDMSGNVAEWVGAYYARYPEGIDAPAWYDLDAGAMRLLRGGDFHRGEELVRTYRRAATLSDTRSFSIGFRCAADR